MEQERYDLTGSLLRWYDYNKRILPWRENKDPLQDLGFGNYAAADKGGSG